MTSSRIVWILVIVALAVVAYAYYATGGDSSGDTVWAKIVLLVQQIIELLGRIWEAVNYWFTKTLGISFSGIGAWIAGVIVKLFELFMAAIGWVIGKFSGA